MNINFSEIKIGFNSYLQEIYKNEGTDLSDVSIFEYCDEFKDYLSEEYNIDSEELLNASVSDLMNMDFFNDEEEGIENSENGETSNFISSFLKDLFKDESFSKEIDTNQDGNIDKEELSNLFNFISKNDENSENISLYDITKGIADIKQGTYKEYNASNGITAGATSDSTATAGASNVSSPAASSGASSGSISSGGAPSSESNSSGGAVSLAFMDEEQLNKELDKRESKVKEKQDALNAIYDGSDRTIAYWQDMVDNAYENYQNQLEAYEVNEELKEQVTEVINNIDLKENEIDDKSKQISEQETTVSNAQTDYDNAVSTRENLESSLSALEGKKGETEEEQAAIDAQIASLRSEIEAAKAAEEAAKTALEEAKTKLETLEQEKSTLETELNGLNQEKTSIESKIIDAEPRMEAAINNYNKQKEAFNNQKTKSIDNAKAEISEAQSDVTEIKTVINENKNRNSTIEYSDNFLGKDIIQYALQFLGYNESDTSADIFLEKWHSSSSQTGWCAAFVSYVYEHMKSADQIPQWYQDIENQYWQVNVHNAAKEAGAIIDSSEAKMGDIVLYDYNGDGTMQHIGIVVAMEGNKMITIEGNSGNQVRIVEYNLDNPANCNMAFCKIT